MHQQATHSHAWTHAHTHTCRTHEEGHTECVGVATHHPRTPQTQQSCQSGCCQSKAHKSEHTIRSANCSADLVVELPMCVLLSLPVCVWSLWLYMWLLLEWAQRFVSTSSSSTGSAHTSAHRARNIMRGTKGGGRESWGCRRKWTGRNRSCGRLVALVGAVETVLAANCAVTYNH